MYWPAKEGTQVSTGEFMGQLGTSQGCSSQNVLTFLWAALERAGHSFSSLCSANPARVFPWLSIQRGSLSVPWGTGQKEPGPVRNSAVSWGVCDLRPASTRGQWGGTTSDPCGYRLVLQGEEEEEEEGFLYNLSEVGTSSQFNYQVTIINEFRVFRLQAVLRCCEGLWIRLRTFLFLGNLWEVPYSIEVELSLISMRSAVCSLKTESKACPYQCFLNQVKYSRGLHWLVWLNGLSTGLWTKGVASLIQSGHILGLQARSGPQ